MVNMIRKSIMMRIRGVVCAAVALLAMSGVMHAATYEPKTVPDPKIKGQWNYVSNPDSILSADDVDYINRCCLMLEDSSGVELAVVAIDSMGDYTPFDFGFELFQRWGIGKAGKNTGVLITFASASRKVQINTGTGIEGVLPDALCSQIIQEDMIPLFKQGDYGGGLCRGVTRIYENCTSGDAPEELLNMKSATNRGGFGGKGTGKDDEPSDLMVIIVVCIIVFLVLFPFLAMVLYQGKKQSTLDEIAQRDGCFAKMAVVCIVFPFLIPTMVWFWHRAKRLRCPQCGRQKYKIVRTEKSAAGVSPKTRMDFFKCSACGYEHMEMTMLPTYSGFSGYSGGSYSGGSDYDSSDYSSSDSDSGSWGGGSSSGGGAGGSW